MKVNRTLNMVHPILKRCVPVIDELIDQHSMPFRLFETGRAHDRHQSLLNKGRTKDVVSEHLFDLSITPPLYATAVDYVYYDGRWSWNLRDETIKSWYMLFGNLVVDALPVLEWGGFDRKNVNVTHFRLKKDTVLANIEQYPCVLT